MALYGVNQRKGDVMGHWYELRANGIAICGYLEVIDQYDVEVVDEDIINAARNVYTASSDLINELLIPGLNDILYANRKFPMGDRDQKTYEGHGLEMMRAAYEVTAYSGLGKIPGKDFIVIPVEPIEIRESWFGHPTFRMSVKILEL
jgi:hypothetical protein